MRFYVIAEVDASALFRNDNVNWRYCTQHATFVHKDGDACEFILHCPPDDDPDVDEHVEAIRAKMRKFGCTKTFIKTWEAAVNAGAYKLLLYV